MRTSEVLIMILLGAGLFMATITVLYVVKVALTLLQGYLDRDPEPDISPDPFPEEIPNPHVKSPDSPPF
jgi:hypothetical protein